MRAAAATGSTNGFGSGAAGTAEVVAKTKNAAKAARGSEVIMEGKAAGNETPPPLSGFWRDRVKGALKPSYFLSSAKMRRPALVCTAPATMTCWSVPRWRLA